MTPNIRKGDLWTPELESLVPVISAGLQDNYESVSVSVVTCPDLRPIGCAVEGLCGSASLVEVGGEPYAHDPIHRDVEFDTAEIIKSCGHPNAAVLGAGMAHRAMLNGHCGEWIPTFQINSHNTSKAAWVGRDKSCVVEDYQSYVHTGLSNLFLSDGQPGPVLEISVETRTGNEGSLPQVIRKSLMSITDGDRQIGMGGVFLIEKGKVRSHISPDYECVRSDYYDTSTNQVVVDILQYYQHMGPDLLCLSVLWTGDPTGGGLHLRESGEHTHFFHRGGQQQAGHYHYDVTPGEIKYTGYFNIGSAIYRVHDIYEALENSQGM